MPRSPSFGLRLDDVTKARWIVAANDRGYPHLGEFVKACVEAEISDDAAPPRRPPTSARAETTSLPTVPPPPVVPPPLPAGGKSTYEPDFKPERKKK